MVLYPNKLPESERVCSGICNFRLWKHSGNRLNVIIQHYKFNTFIAMFLIISEIYLFLFRTHVKYIKTKNKYSEKLICCN